MKIFIRKNSEKIIRNSIEMYFFMFFNIFSAQRY